MRTAGVLDTVQASARLGVSRGTLTKALKAGELPARRLGRRWLIPATALDRWLESGTPEPTPPPAPVRRR